MDTNARGPSRVKLPCCRDGETGFEPASEKFGENSRMESGMFVCLFGEGARARSVATEASAMAQKIVRRTSFEATRDSQSEGNIYIF